MVKDYKDIQDFIDNFNIVDNCLDMRTLKRWNGRNLSVEENLSEHTHLVTACAIELYDRFKVLTLKETKRNCLDFEQIIRLAMIHDSVELFRGDILSITKDAFKEIKDVIDYEEDKFYLSYLENLYEINYEIVKLADLMACYKFIENLLQYPSNDFTINVYKTTKKKFEDKLLEFQMKYLLNFEVKIEEDLDCRFAKGYYDDAGVDVILNKPVEFMPKSTTKIDLDIYVTPKENQMGFLCSRTSAAAKGLIVAMCPIDPNYTGNVTAIVHNISNNIIKYDKGEAFCQVLMTPINNFCDITSKDKIKIKKNGKRTDGKLGSTGGDGKMK